MLVLTRSATYDDEGPGMSINHDKTIYETIHRPNGKQDHEHRSSLMSRSAADHQYHH